MALISDFPGNPQLKKQEENTKEREHREPVVSNAATVVEKKGLRRIFGSLVKDNAKSLGDYLLRDVIFPNIMRALCDIGHTGIDVLIYGESRQGSRSSIGSSRSYDSYYRNKQEPKSTIINRVRSVDSFDDIMYDSYYDADRVLGEMKNIIDQCDSVSVRDYYELSKVPNAPYTFTDYGWTNLDGVKPIPSGGRYFLNLPPPVNIR